MKNTDYKGIDYGLGQSNIDKQTGIHFGVISQHSISPEAFEDVYQNSRDLSFEAYQQEAKDKLRSALSDYFSDHKWGDQKQSKLDCAVQDAFEAIESDLNDRYECDQRNWLYEDEGYKLTNCLDFDVFILKSPYYTFAQFCSPCVPGAGNIDNPCADGPKTYCLGHDWFEDSKAPYPVYSVETGEEVKSESK